MTMTEEEPKVTIGTKRGSGTRVFIGQAPGGRSRGLNDDTKDEDLRSYFERYGTVTGIAQHRWEDTNKKKGFGYIEFAEFEAAQAALGIHTVSGVALEVKLYTAGAGSSRSAGAVTPHTGGLKRSFGGGFGGGYGGGRGNTTRVFIGQAPGGRSRGLNDDIKDEHLRTHFERYGTVTGIAQHKWEDSGKKKGFGYIEFAEYEAAQAALGIHHVEGVALEVKMYQQGAGRNGPSAAAQPNYGAGDYGYGGGWGYGADTKRPRMEPGGAQSSAAMMEQMKSMMVQMQQMQQQVQGGGGGMSEQLQQMQQTMYSMMQHQYMSALGGSAANGAGGYGGYSSTNPYQYPSSSYDYSKGTPKPPGTDRY